MISPPSIGEASVGTAAGAGGDIEDGGDVADGGAGGEVLDGGCDVAAGAFDVAAGGFDVVDEGAALESEAASAQAPSTAMRIGGAIDRGTATSYQIPTPDRPDGSSRRIEARWIGAWGIG
jgi:hypothetical protein